MIEKSFEHDTFRLKKVRPREKDSYHFLGYVHIATVDILQFITCSIFGGMVSLEVFALLCTSNCRWV